METSAANTDQGTAAPEDAMARVSGGRPSHQAKADPDPVSSIRHVLHPIVQITPADGVKRLGTGSHRWFSESVHVAVGRKIEFRFQGPMHLLASYDEGARRNGETSIDGLHPSRLRSFVHKLTFVPAGRAYREWHETGATTRVNFLYLDPAVLHRPDTAKARSRPECTSRIPLFGRQRPN